MAEAAPKPDPALTVLILTRNEEVHIGRAIASVGEIARHVVVVDSGSTDRTMAIARAHGAMVFTRAWAGYADQFNWALHRLPADTQWVLRLDADEIVTPDLADQIRHDLPKLGNDVAGVILPRFMTFLRHPIRHGGVSPSRSVRLFRHGRGRCETRWMDEHILVDGDLATFKGAIIDDSLKPLEHWIAKHCAYADREAADLLALKYGLHDRDLQSEPPLGDPAGRRRWIKCHLYARLPRGLRALIYFLYRYVVRAGFRDGLRGTAFHLLQGFGYRFLVDARIVDVEKHMRIRNTDPASAIDAVLGIAMPAKAGKRHALRRGRDLGWLPPSIVRSGRG